MAAAGPSVLTIPNGHDEPFVSIAIVTYGTGPIVLDALAAIASNTRVAYEVVVVDNPPPTGVERTAELLRTTTSGAHVIEANQNLGFGGGNNLAVEHARGAFVCLLNPDVIVGPGWLEPLIAALDDPVVGIAAPILLNPDGTLQEAGQLLYDDGCTAAMGGPEVRTGDWQQAFTRDIDYASAACWLVRRADFVALGGFDERYHPAYFEDVDYALRVEASGKRTRLVVDKPVEHHHGRGVATSDPELGPRSRDTFRSIWHERLTHMPSRPTDRVGALANRDRLAQHMRGWRAPTRSTSIAERRAALSVARSDALAHGRDRVVFVTDSDDGLDVAAARSAGVEFVVGDVDGETRSRPHVDWTTVPSDGVHVRRLFSVLWSPWTLAGVAASVLAGWFVCSARRWIGTEGRQRPGSSAG